MIFLELAIVLAAIVFGARLGSIGIGFAGGLGVLALALLGVKPGTIPIGVLLIIMSVISAIAAMQVAGGLDYLVSLAEKLLRKNPKHITIFAPLVTYTMTVMAGTSHTSFSTLPIIAEVAKEQGVRPSRPLSIAVVASLIAITASPISAAVVYMATIMGGIGVDYLQILMVCIPTTLLGVILAAFVTNFLGKDLKDDEVYQQRKKEGKVVLRGASNIEILPYAKRSVWIFVSTIVLVTSYAILTSDLVSIIPKEKIILTRDNAIMILMLSAAATISLSCKINTSQVLNANTFKSGMSACVCLLGVAWLGSTFITARMDEITMLAGNMLQNFPWMLAIILFFSSMLLYSQSATAIALIPMAIALGATPVTILASFVAAGALYFLPTYPTLLAAVEMDDTGSTRIGRYVFDHPFTIPGLCAIFFSVVLGFIWGGIVL